MIFHIITLFPDMFQAIREEGVVARAHQAGTLDFQFYNPRDFSENKHRQVDDRPYGGGPGMVMQAPPLARAIRAAQAKAQKPAPVIYLSPQGQHFSHKQAVTLQAHHELILICGRYEGVDQRIIDQFVDLEISIGDFVVSGGELPAMLLIDAISRLIPGVLGCADSAQQDTFVDNRLDHPHYTRPAEFEGQQVPAVLQQGDHKAIEAWRKAQSEQQTRLKRPDLLES